MKRRLTLAGLLLCQALAAPPMPATAAETDTNAPSKPAGAAPGVSLESFQIIAERNIFNPNRSGRSRERVDREFTRRETEPRSRTDSLLLLGTMSYEKGRFAFFDGSSSDYRRAVQTSDTIAGLTVAAITPKAVTFHVAPINTTGTANDTNAITETNGVTVTPETPETPETNATIQSEITLPMGMQLQRRNQGQWEVTARTDDGPSTRSSTFRSSTGASASLPGSDDVLKRLMQQREQQEGGTPPASGDTAAQPPQPAQPDLSEQRTTPTAPAPAPSTGSADDVLKRLMQRREKENDK